MNMELSAAIILISTFCLFLCRAEDDADICKKTHDKGSPSGCDSPSSGRKFFFDSVTTRCQPFPYYGCGGNENRFDTLAECKTKCADTFKSVKKGSATVLSVPKCDGGVRAAVGNDTHVLKCPGEDQCPEGYKCADGKCCPATKDVVCGIEYDTGKYVKAGKHTPRFFYKTSNKNCQLFTYYGALGNANNFETYKACMSYCKSA